ncbi:uncharacterized protein LOC143025192 [Oratosquilla oratoria]|uniref:uncharacterized protein LOC143025192 n=1 Tax=Oratosquilla oratoria TaxID=337810 RepID=UPI003F767264
MDSLLTDVKPMRIPRPKFFCAKSIAYPVEPPKDYLDLDLVLDVPDLKSKEKSCNKLEDLGRALQEKMKV